MHMVSERIRGYAGNDPAIKSIVDALAREEVEYEEHLSAPQRKTRYYAAQHMMRSRDFQGRSKRQKS